MHRYLIPFLILISGNICLYSQVLPDLKEESHIYEKIYDAPLKLSTGEQVTLQELVFRKPVVLAFIFTRCSGICAPFLLNLNENIHLKQLDERKPFDIVVISFDKRDSLKDMIRLAERLDLTSDPQWKFAVTDSIQALINSLGFSSLWNDTLKQFDHDALLVGINTHAFITRKLIGMRDRKDLDLLIGSIHNEFAPTYRLPTSNSIFSCFNYDPSTGKNKPGMGLMFIALPVVLALLIFISLRLIVRRKV